MVSKVSNGRMQLERWGPIIQGREIEEIAMRWRYIVTGYWGGDTIPGGRQTKGKQ